jgi:alkylhydroperoxidase family enzyme
VGRTHGITEAELRALPSYESSDVFSALEKRVIAYAVAMTKTPVEVSDALHAELRAALGDEALVELTAAIGWENYRARFNHALGMEAEGYSEGAYCPLPANHPALAKESP